MSNPVCGIASCDSPDGGGVTLSCQGEWVSECRQGTQTANENCKVWDQAKCKVANNASSCVGSGGACVDGANRCWNVNPKIWLTCKSGQEAAFDCTQQELNCVAAVTDGGTTGVTGCRNGNACDTAIYEETCNAGVLTYCDFGAIKTLDCKATGWNTCVPRVKNGMGVLVGGYCMK